MKTARPDRYRVLFDSSQDAHFIVDSDGILDCNEATVRLLKSPGKEEVLKVHPARLSPEYQPDGEKSVEKSARMDAIAREKGWHRFEWVHRKFDGEEFPVEVTLNAVEIDGKSAIIAVWHDLTEIKRTEKRLSEMAGELRSKNEALSRVNDRMSLELRTAADAQRSLLPQASPYFPGIRAEWFFRPSRELAGDSLNVFRVGEDHLGFYVLDVSGHGVSSALVSVTVTQFLSSFQAPGVAPTPLKNHLSCPSACAARLNDHFSVHAPGGHFFTLVYGVIDTRSLDFSYVAAGQAGPVVVRADGTAERCPTTAMPIGLMGNLEFEERRIRLGKGDRIYFFSDGVYEARRAAGEEYGLDRLLSFLDRIRPLPVKEGVDRLIKEIEHWAYPDPLHDDVSLIAVETAAR